MRGDPFPKNYWIRKSGSLIAKVVGDSIGSLVDYINGVYSNLLSLDITYTPSGSEPVGSTYWDFASRTLSTVLEDGVIGQHFKEVFIDGQNDTGSTIANGTPVEYLGSIGNSGNFRITPASSI